MPILPRPPLPLPAHRTASPPPPPLPIGEYAALVGLDWGERQHAIALQPRQGALERLVLPHSAEELHGWLEALGVRFAGARVAVAVEASKGAVVSALLAHAWIVVYPIHPTTSRSFSQAFTPSGAKDDGPDAAILLEILQHHRSRLRALLPQEPATRRLELLSQCRRKLVDRRTQLTNQLQSLLKNYYPQALQLLGPSLYSSLALDFLERWPELAALQKARPQTLRNFYYAHRVRRPATIETRLALQAQARALTTDAVLCEVSVLQLRALVAAVRLLNQQVRSVEQHLQAAFLAHPDAVLFAHLPGAGQALAPRLCALFGTDRARWPNAAALQKYYGVAPVQERSGQACWVHWRWSAPAFARQSLVEWAGLSVKACAWAKAFYLQQKAKGQGHSAILRSLAFKWLRILWRCWQDAKPYDDARYLAQLQLRQVAFLRHLPLPPTDLPATT